MSLLWAHLRCHFSAPLTPRCSHVTMSLPWNLSPVGNSCAWLINLRSSVTQLCLVSWDIPAWPWSSSRTPLTLKPWPADPGTLPAQSHQQEINSAVLRVLGFSCWSLQQGPRSVEIIQLLSLEAGVQKLRLFN